ncbi:putative transposase, Ptta/En/Spm, plant [Dillenia turbinata]|uniref:Transposase, Ptta/En/Spm, plant n=1 Tax=Dillenia turbinata TaxID=194707 RepID=A0AAN8VC51_9MAGN
MENLLKSSGEDLLSPEFCKSLANSFRLLLQPSSARDTDLDNASDQGKSSWEHGSGFSGYLFGSAIDLLNMQKHPQLVVKQQNQSCQSTSSLQSSSSLPHELQITPLRQVDLRSTGPEPLQPENDTGTSPSDLSSQRRSKRGATIGLKAAKARASSKGPLEIDIVGGIAVGENRQIFLAEFGATVREHFTLRVKKWIDMDPLAKQEFFARIRNGWAIANDEDTFNTIIGMAETKWVDYRCRLHAKVSDILDDPSMHEECMRRRPSKMISVEDWMWLLEYWRTDAGFRKRSRAGKSNRAKVKWLHTSGQRAFKAIEDEMERTNGRKPDALELWKKTHTKKSGDWISEDARKTYVSASHRLQGVEVIKSSDSTAAEVVQLPPVDQSQILHEVVGYIPGSYERKPSQSRSRSVVALLQAQLEEERHKHEEERCKLQEKLRAEQEERHRLEEMIHKDREELFALKAKLDLFLGKFNNEKKFDTMQVA